MIELLYPLMDHILLVANENVIETAIPFAVLSLTQLMLILFTMLHQSTPLVQRCASCSLPGLRGKVISPIFKIQRGSKALR